MANNEIEYDVVVNGKKAIVSINGVEKAQIDLEKTVTKSTKKINVNWVKLGATIATASAAMALLTKSAMNNEQAMFGLSDSVKEWVKQTSIANGLNSEMIAGFARSAQTAGLSETQMKGLTEQAIALGRAYPHESMETLMDNLIMLNTTGEAQGFVVDILEQKYKSMDIAALSLGEKLSAVESVSSGINEEFQSMASSKINTIFLAVSEGMKSIGNFILNLVDRTGMLDKMIDYFKELGLIGKKTSQELFIGLDETDIAINEFLRNQELMAKKVAETNKQIAKSFEDAFANNMTNTLMDFMEDGKASFGDFAKSIANDIARIIIQAQIARPIAQSIMGTGFGAGLTVAGGGTATPSQSGAVISGGIKQRFAKGGVTTMPQMRGNTLIGEAGAEAVMPLTRTSNGDLGVKMIGSGGNNNQVVNVDLTVNAIDSQSFQAALINDRQTIKNVIIEAVNTDTNMKRTIKNV